MKNFKLVGLLLMFKNSKKSKFKRIYLSRYKRFNVGEYYIKILIEEVIFDLFRVKKRAKHDKQETTLFWHGRKVQFWI